MRYAREVAKARRACSFPQKEPVMTRIELYSHAADADPMTSFATAAEIELADQLRHQLEERYLARTAPSSSCSDETSPSLRPFDDTGGTQ
jgi:hypothetical protein